MFVDKVLHEGINAHCGSFSPVILKKHCEMPDVNRKSTLSGTIEASGLSHLSSFTSDANNLAWNRNVETATQ